VSVTELLVAGHVADLLAARRMQRMIDATRDHLIIRGFGRVGRQVARDLRGDIRGGSCIVGLRRAAGGFVPQPEPGTALEPGDVIMAMGTPRTMDRPDSLFAPTHAGAQL